MKKILKLLGHSPSKLYSFFFGDAMVIGGFTKKVIKDPKT